ncbi:SDR family NAD(P)-dependent oxidoreductase [Nocardia sp. NPDC059239]|uniref:SDR family NAD(P)-dependent oxidoreductase n=1 Tax=unclassified Nocardia TaxID=2637762 RepID=UPI0036BA05EC
MSKLSTPVVVVTGAARGIGRAIATSFSQAGAAVVVTDVDLAAAQQTAMDLGGTTIAVHTDVTSLESVENMAAEVRKAFGRIDVLVNNAGWDKVSPFVDSAPKDWDTVMAINLLGVLHTSKTVLPMMIEQGGGRVVNVASDAGRVGSSGEAVYSAAKGGVVAFSKSTAREMARHGVTVNCVCPGPTDTALLASIGGDDPKLRDALVKAIPLRRLAQPADIANAVTFFAAEESGYITGQTLSVSGGLTMS